MHHSLLPSHFSPNFGFRAWDLTLAICLFFVIYLVLVISTLPLLHTAHLPRIGFDE